MSLKNILAGAAAAFTVAATGTAVSADAICVDPLPMVGVTVNEEGVSYDLKRGDEVISMVLYGDTAKGDHVLLSDLVEDGIVSPAMADFSQADLGAGQDSMMEAMTFLAEKTDGYSLVDNGLITEVSARFRSEGSSMDHEIAGRLSDEDVRSGIIQYFGKETLDRLNELAQMTRGMVLGHAQIASECYIELESKEGVLRPMARPTRP